MRSVGFTLIELLIVLSIISILTIVGVVNFKDYAQDQVTIKATGQIQSLLRTAQRNSSSSVKCTDTEPAVSWLVDFKDATSDSNHRTITLSCKSPTSSEIVIKSLVLDNNVAISRVTTNPACQTVEFPNYEASLVYGVPLGQIDFFIARNASGNLKCQPNAQIMTVTIQDNKNPPNTKNITVSKGGEINVQNVQ